MTSADADMTRDVLAAIERALAGDWAAAHGLVQCHEGRPPADWVHAVLHKIEGDVSNSRYWYRAAGRSFEAYPDPMAELAEIRASLT